MKPNLAAQGQDLSSFWHVGGGNMLRPTVTLITLLNAEPLVRDALYEKCLSSMQATKDLASDLQSLTTSQASSLCKELQVEWAMSGNNRQALHIECQFSVSYNPYTQLVAG